MATPAAQPSVKMTLLLDVPETLPRGLFVAISQKLVYLSSFNAQNKQTEPVKKGGRAAKVLFLAKIGALW